MLISRLAHDFFHKGVKEWLFGQQAQANLPATCPALRSATTTDMWDSSLLLKDRQRSQGCQSLQPGRCISQGEGNPRNNLQPFWLSKWSHLHLKDQCFNFEWPRVYQHVFPSRSICSRKKSSSVDKRTLQDFRARLSLFHRTHIVPDREILSGSAVCCR